MQTIWNDINCFIGGVPLKNKKQTCHPERKQMWKMFPERKNVFARSPSLSSRSQPLTHHWSLWGTFAACPLRWGQRGGGGRGRDVTKHAAGGFGSCQASLPFSTVTEETHFTFYCFSTMWNLLPPPHRHHISELQTKKKNKYKNKVIMTIRGATAFFHTPKFQVTIKWCHTCCFSLSPNKLQKTSILKKKKPLHHIKR